MVILKDVEVNILVNGTKAPEFRDRYEPVPKPRCRHFIRKYIEVRPDVTYVIQTRIPQKTKIPAAPGFETLTCHIEIDGHHVKGIVWPDFSCTEVIDGQRVGTDPDMKIYPFVIESLVATRNSTSSRDLDWSREEEIEQRFNQRLGTIVVTVHRSLKLVEVENGGSGEQESGLQNQDASPNGSVDLRTRLGSSGRPVGKPGWVDAEYIDPREEPYLVFHFYYRHRQALLNLRMIGENSRRLSSIPYSPESSRSQSMESWSESRRATRFSTAASRNRTMEPPSAPASATRSSTVYSRTQSMGPPSKLTGARKSSTTSSGSQTSETPTKSKRATRSSKIKKEPDTSDDPPSPSPLNRGLPIRPHPRDAPPGVKVKEEPKDDSSGALSLSVTLPARPHHRHEIVDSIENDPEAETGQQESDAEDASQFGSSTAAEESGSRDTRRRSATPPDQPSAAGDAKRRKSVEVATDGKSVGQGSDDEQSHDTEEDKDRESDDHA